MHRSGAILGKWRSSSKYCPNLLGQDKAGSSGVPAGASNAVRLGSEAGTNLRVHLVGVRARPWLCVSDVYAWRRELPLWWVLCELQ